MIARRRFAYMLLPVFLVTVPAAAQERREVPPFRAYGEPGTAEDASAIDRLMDRYKTAWAAQNADAFIALHMQNIEWINAYARLFQGATPLADFLRNRLFPAFSQDVSKQEVANMRTISIRYLGRDAVVVHMYTEGNRGPSRNANEDVRRTHIHLVLGKESNEWKVAHTAIMDAR